MRRDTPVDAPIHRPLGLRTLRRWSRNEEGATAIEFAILAGPFFLFVFGIIGVGLHFFTLSTLEHAVASAARQIRTGQAQSGGVTVGDFKRMIVDNSGGLVNSSKLVVHIDHESDWVDLTPTKCLTGDGKMTPPTGGKDDAIGQYTGGGSEVVVVTACYEWETAKALSILGFGNLEGGSSLIQAATTFRTEPYQ